MVTEKQWEARQTSARFVEYVCLCLKTIYHAHSAHLDFTLSPDTGEVCIRALGSVPTFMPWDRFVRELPSILTQSKRVPTCCGVTYVCRRGMPMPTRGYHGRGYR